MIELFFMVSDFQDVAEVRNFLEQYALEKINESESDALGIV